MFPSDRMGKGSYLHQRCGCYWNNATVAKGQEGNTYCCKVRLNTFLFILSFELIFFYPGILSSHYALRRILDALWVWSKSKIKDCYELDCWTGHCCFCKWNEAEIRGSRRNGRGLVTSLMHLFPCYFPRLYWQ